jgi:hypothetical protein
MQWHMPLHLLPLFAASSRTLCLFPTLPGKEDKSILLCVTSHRLIVHFLFARREQVELCETVKTCEIQKICTNYTKRHRGPLSGQSALLFATERSSTRW